VWAVNGVAFIPATDVMVTVGQDGTALLWDVGAPATPRRMDQTLSGPSGHLRAVAVAPDGESVATGGADGTTTVWDLDRLNRIRADPVGFGCQVAWRDLDTTERQR
jgi:WD40 repeat protein